MGGQGPNMQQFEAYFQRADVDRDGRISGSEAVAFLQASNLPRQVLAQIWNYADQNRSGFLGRPEFYNALKLVTVAQSKRDLTPELVKAALYGSASSKIPAPQINLAALPAPQPNMNTGPSPGQVVRPPTSTQGVGLSGPLSHLTQQSQTSRPPLTPSVTPGFHAQPGSSTQAIPGMGSMPASQLSNSFNSLGGTMDGSGGGISSQVFNKNIIPSATPASTGSHAAPIVQSKPSQVTASLQPTSPMKNDAASLFSQVGKEDSKSPLAAGNGFASDSMFGDALSAKPQPHLNSTPPMYSAGSMPASSAGSLTYSKDQPAAKINSTSQPPAIPSQQFQSSGKANQNVSQKSSAFLPAAGQFHAPWPRMTQSDVQKYSKVFVQVDTDKDGKITGEQARNLFLSWRLPREVLKQVWDLSDQDNDSMLSLREFCIALYLMERFREGRPLPVVLPASVIVDEAFLHASGQPNAAYGNMSWRRPTPGFQQSQGTKNAQLIPSAGGGRPPRPVPVPQPDEPVQQKAKVPDLEKHLLDQLSKEEQDSLNKKLDEAKEAEKKVADLEKDIHEARQKIQFYHAKMQELILYKSRCDNRLNEISEKVVADKREADSLAKKYEDKYKQGGDVASRLTLEEATFRDIQEKKMELYRSIVKLEQDNADNVKDQATQIQSDLDELVKGLNERCKTYGLRGKPTTLVELPFGWQPGIAATAADWDEVWDKLEEEGYTFVKELTLEVQNVAAPPKPKSTVIREKVTYLDDRSTVKSLSKASNTSEVPNSGEKISDDLARTPPDSPAGSNAAVSPSKEFHDIRKSKDFNIDEPMPTFDTFDTQSEYGAESIAGDRGYGETGWGSFDTHYDSDAAWDFNHAKEAEHEKHGESSLFGGDNWGLNPIRTRSKGTDMNMPKQGPFFDSVPSTPLSYPASSPHADNLFMKKPSIFADSVPSTPMYNSTASPRRFSEGSEDRNYFDSFSRYDSFNMHDSGPFGSRDSFGRFDSFNMSDSTPLGSREFSRVDTMQSTRDSDFDYNSGSKELFNRFDSFRSTADSDYNFGHAPPRETFSRYDSIRSTRDSDYGHSFPSFDDSSEPFGSGSPFKTSSEAQWNNDSLDPFGSGAPFKPSFDAQTPWRDDVTDPFGSSGLFKTSFDSQTPRKDDAADPFASSGPFKTSHETETSRRGYDSWNAF